jgi:hypothetical protein
MARQIFVAQGQKAISTRIVANSDGRFVMSGKMRWHMQRYVGRPTLNIRDEEEQLARADRWLAKARHRRRKRRGSVMASSARMAQRPTPRPQPLAKPADWTVTAVSSGWAVLDATGAVMRGGFTNNSAAWEWADRQERRTAWKTPYFATTASSSTEEAPPW